MNSIKDILKSKVASWIALALIGCYIAIYLFKDPSTMPMENIQNIIMLIVGFYFGSSDTDSSPKK